MYSRKKLTWARWLIDYIPYSEIYDKSPVGDTWLEPHDYAHLVDEPAEFYETTQESDTESDNLLDIEIYEASLTTTESYSESE